MNNTMFVHLTATYIQVLVCDTNRFDPIQPGSQHIEEIIQHVQSNIKSQDTLRATDTCTRF